MKKQEFIQIKGSDMKELGNKVKDIKKEIAELCMEKNMKKLKDLKLISKKRKDMAQILTVIRQKELLVQLESKVEKSESGKKVPEEEKIKTSSPTKIKQSKKLKGDN